MRRPAPNRRALAVPSRPHFDVAAEAWACRVQAWLGIARQVYDPRVGRDRDPVEEGAPYQRADYAAERCLDGQAWSACAYPPGEGGEGGPDKPWMHDPVVPTTPDRLSP